MSKGKVITGEFEYTVSGDDVIVPYKLYKEWRNEVRISVNHNGGIMRVPVMSFRSVDHYLQDFELWLRDVMAEKDSIRQKFLKADFTLGKSWQILGGTYYLKYHNHSQIKLINNEVFLPTYFASYPVKELRKAISKVFAKRCKVDIENRVHFFNEKYFGKSINRISLRYTMTRWGSCSTKNNITLSTRLLLAPKHVLDYVIVHELAHLVEMNHSERFWAEVSKVMPDYLNCEEWLKNDGATLDF